MPQIGGQSDIPRIAALPIFSRCQRRKILHKKYFRYAFVRDRLAFGICRGSLATLQQHVAYVTFALPNYCTFAGIALGIRISIFLVVDSYISYRVKCTLQR